MRFLNWIADMVGRFLYPAYFSDLDYDDEVGEDVRPHNIKGKDDE